MNIISCLENVPTVVEDAVPLLFDLLECRDLNHDVIKEIIVMIVTKSPSARVSALEAVPDLLRLLSSSSESYSFTYYVGPQGPSGNSFCGVVQCDKVRR
jgi:hypothetical protein